jgi:hypothetical protein
MPAFRALIAQIAVLAALLVVRRYVPFQTPAFLWALLQAIFAMQFGRMLRLGPYWLAFQFALPIAVWAHFAFDLPIWAYPAVLAALLLVYGGGMSSKVPLYNSGRAAWAALTGFVPEDRETVFIDLGAGLGGPLAHIARHRPLAILQGSEASPLVWLVAWLRTMRYRPRCTVRLGSIWKTDISGADVVYAFLSPAPMPELWAKARREMKPGALLISHSFEAPGQAPIQRIPLPGRKGAALLVYKVN